MSGKRPHTAGLVLAAGRGTRFGGGKMLAEIDGRPMLQHVLDLAASASLDPVVVVLGEDADEVERLVNWRGEIRVRNEDPGRGISSSLVLGLRELGDVERVLVLLGDQPFLTPAQVDAILAAPRDPYRPIVVPMYGGISGNPVLLEREAVRLAGELRGDQGMSQLFAAHTELVRYVEVEGANPDIDTPAALEAARSRAIVAAGYDALGERYAQWSSRVVDPARERMITEFSHRLSPGAQVLDLGCGPGVPSTKQLAERFEVTGVDFSAVQIAAARRKVPRARFIQADMTTIDFGAAAFDGVVALYSFNRIPRSQLPVFVARIARWLRPGGLLLATLSAGDSRAWTGEWLTVRMFFSGFSSATNRELFARAGFDLIVDEEVDVQEPEGRVRFQWLLAAVNRA